MLTWRRKEKVAWIFTKVEVTAIRSLYAHDFPCQRFSLWFLRVFECANNRGGRELFVHHPIGSAGAFSRRGSHPVIVICRAGRRVMQVVSGLGEPSANLV